MSANLTNSALNGMYPFLTQVAALRRCTRDQVRTRAVDSPAAIANTIIATATGASVTAFPIWFSYYERCR